EILLEVESEKATQGIPSPAAGTLHISAKEGDKVEVGAVLGDIDDSAVAPPAKEAPASKPSGPAKAEKPKPRPPTPDKEAKASPAARRLAGEEGVDVTKVAGSGRHGVVLKEDVADQAKRKARKESPPAAPSPAAEGEKRVPMTAIRQRIAERLVT